jgi:predicted nucleic acid-binding protein
MFTETASALTRARRARRLTKGREIEFRARLDEIWRSISAVPADWPTVRAAAELCARHRLHALDALHLASALSIAPLIDVFVAGDRRLLTAARAEGFATAEV